MDTLPVNFLLFFYIPAFSVCYYNSLLVGDKTKPSTWLGLSPESRIERELGSQDFGEVSPDSAVIGTVELHHVFLDTSLADD